MWLLLWLRGPYLSLNTRYISGFDCPPNSRWLPGKHRPPFFLPLSWTAGGRGSFREKKLKSAVFFTRRTRTNSRSLLSCYIQVCLHHLYLRIFFSKTMCPELCVRYTTVRSQPMRRCGRTVRARPLLRVCMTGRSATPSGRLHRGFLPGCCSCSRTPCVPWQAAAGTACADSNPGGRSLKSSLGLWCSHVLFQYHSADGAWT